MIVMEADAGAVQRARAYVRKSSTRARRKGLHSAFVGHAFLVEAMTLLLNCDVDRSEALANGLLVLAVADQRQFLERGGIPIGVSMDTAEQINALREYAGFDDH